MATMKKFRCGSPKCQQTDGGIFNSEQGICPQCGLNEKCPKFGRMIHRLVMIHYDPPTEFPGVGHNHRACDPTKAIQAQEWQGGIPNPWNIGTGDVMSVTCDACKQTPEYKAGLEIAESEDGPSNNTAAAMNRLQSVASYS